MISLTNNSSTTTTKLQASLSGAAATTNPTVTVISYIVPPQSKPDFSEYRRAPQFTVLAGATETDIADAPPSGSVKDVIYIACPNPDTAAITISFFIDDNGTNRLQYKAVIPVGGAAYYDGTEGGRGWYTLSSTGALVTNAGISSISSSTDNAVVRWDGATGALIQNSGVTIDDSNNASGIVNITTTGSSIIGDTAASDTHVITGTTTVVGTAGANQFRLSASGGDLWLFNVNAAGGGGAVAMTNSAVTDYEPIAIEAESVNLRYRTGVLTLADGLTVALASGVTSFLDFSCSRTDSGNPVIGEVANASNTAGSGATQLISVAGATADDPKLEWNIAGVLSWSSGIDNSDSDKWKLCASTTIGTNTALTVDTSLNATLAGDLTIAAQLAGINGITTSGNLGTSAIVATGRSTAQTGAVASVSTYTVGASDGSFEVSANVLVTASTVHNFTVTCAYTDEGNTARTQTMSFSNLAGAALTAITNAAGAVPANGFPLHIRCKAATAITIATTGTFTTVTYNVEGVIKQTN